MTKKNYMKPTMEVVKIQQDACILNASNYGLSNGLNITEVSSAWSRGDVDWSDDEE